MRTAGLGFLVATMVAAWACGGTEGNESDPGPGTDESAVDATDEGPVDPGAPDDGPGLDVRPDPGPDALPPACQNGRQDGWETDVDCGGAACRPCAFRERCEIHTDCMSGWCDPKGLCGVAACNDGAKNGTETDRDCGGTCTPCEDGQGCQKPGDCKNGRCEDNVCVLGDCEDGYKNGDETDVDCGGACDVCETGKACKAPDDCFTGLCSVQMCKVCKAAKDCPGTDTPCRTRTCLAGNCGVSFAEDGANGGTQIPGDCRRLECNGQGETVTRSDPTDVEDDQNPCTIDTCEGETPTHTNVDEFIAIAVQTAGDCKVVVCDGQGAKRTDTDDADLPDDQKSCTENLCNAGVPSNPPLPPGTECSVGAGKVCNGSGSCVECVADGDCASKVCTAFKCVAATCKDGVWNGLETAKDCGGPTCAGCAPDLACEEARDCLEKVCFEKVCLAPTCEDDVRNGLETDQDCGGDACPKCLPGSTCGDNDDCLSGHCVAGRCLECLDLAECPASPGECLSPVCLQNACGFDEAPFGTPSKTQTAGDCREVICNGSGGTAKLIDDADVPVDGRECTQDLCADGIPSNPPVEAGSPCTQDGGTKCNASGACVP